MDKHVLIFDGQCAICQGSAALVRRLDWRHRFELLDAHGEAVVRRFPELDRRALLGAMHLMGQAIEVIRSKGHEINREEAEAVRYQVRYLPLLAWLAPIFRLPGMDWLGPRLYALVARSRYRLNRLLGRPIACESGTCGVPHRSPGESIPRD